MSLNVLEIAREVIDIKSKIISMIFGNKKMPENKFMIKNNRTFITSGEMLQFTAKETLKAQETTKKASYSFKKLIKEPDKLIKFIESKGTKVIIAKHIDKVLRLLGEAEGFVPPQEGLNALLLSLAINLLSKTKIKIGFQTPALFVASSLNFNPYFLAYQYHHWVAYITKLSGYDVETQQNFKNIWKADFSQKDIDNMSVNQILALKDAIKRDVEAIDFAKSMSREIIGSKNALEKMKNNQAVNL